MSGVVFATFLFLGGSPGVWLLSGVVFATVFVSIPKVTLGTFSDCCFVRFGLGSRWCLAFSNRRGWYPLQDTSCSLVALCLV